MYIFLCVYVYILKLNLVKFVCFHYRVSLGDCIPPSCFVIERAAVFVGATVQRAEDVAAAALETCESHSFLA